MSVMPEHAPRAPYPVVWIRIPGRMRRLTAIVVGRRPGGPLHVYADNGRSYVLPATCTSRPRRNAHAQASGLRLTIEYARVRELLAQLAPHNRARRG